MSTTAVEIPGYVAGSFTIDPGHSDVAFTVRHMMVSKVRGHFNRFQGEHSMAGRFGVAPGPGRASRSGGNLRPAPSR